MFNIETFMGGDFFLTVEFIFFLALDQTMKLRLGERTKCKPVSQQQQQPAHQREVVVRRFKITFRLDLFLILKVAAVIFLLNQDGSRKMLWFSLP